MFPFPVLNLSLEGRLTGSRSNVVRIERAEDEHRGEKGGLGGGDGVTCNG